uniref:Uncharacterized protein n=1 Tax=Chelydra serpentina TaxID=8475 RepID=A0A8C3RWA4_CHESE
MHKLNGDLSHSSLELLSDPPTAASQAAGITGTRHHTGLQLLITMPIFNHLGQKFPCWVSASGSISWKISASLVPPFVRMGLGGNVLPIMVLWNDVSGLLAFFFNA